ncbi:MAG TPA: zf-TFIIB domain-containing protein [Xanthomonadales bacterium]|nr:zf-TFIIB domain-containing protein [Xanthomonadales bacterium]
MHCPKCFAAMEDVTFRESALNRCTGCKGLWFAPDVLAALRKDAWMAEFVLDEGRAKVGKEYNRVRDIKCPQCGEAMAQESDPQQQHITYESCPRGHGTFLDAGEFSDMVHKTFWDRFKPSR